MKHVHLGLLLLAGLLMAATGLRDGSPPMPQYPVLSSYFVPNPSAATLKALSQTFIVDHRVGRGYEVLVPAYQSAEFLRLAPEARLLEADIDAELKRMGESWLTGYHDFPGVEAHLRALAEQFPKLVTLEVYGKSKDGRPLYALKLSDNVAQDEEEPELMLTSATHGNELISVEVLLGILDTLVKGYGTEDRLTKMVDSHEIFFLPVVSPDGYVEKSRFANGVDPNREYPGPDEPDKKPNECIQGVIDFFHAHHIVGSIDFHSHGGVVMYPWAYTDGDLPAEDEKTFANLTTKMAENNQYRHGQIAKLLYPATGSSADYYYWKNKTIALGVEIGDKHVPNPAQIPKYLKQNLESTFQFIEHFK